MILNIKQHNIKLRKDKALDKSLLRKRSNHNPIKIRKEYINWMNESEYCYFVTITFQYNSTLLQRIQHINKLLRFVNERIFGKKYFKKNQYLEGFVTVEYHKSGLPHFHMIVKKNPKIDRKGYSTFDEIFDIASNKVRYDEGSNGVHVFGDYSIVIKKVYDGSIVKYVKDGVKKEGNIVGYVTKDTWKLGVENILPLSKSGICLPASLH